MQELWQDIPGREGHYQASTLGRIRSLDRFVPGVNGSKRLIKGRVLRPGRYDKCGHVSVVLGRGENGKPVHQLVAATFLGECPLNQEVLHINGDPADNRLENLRYGTRTDNILDVYRQGKAWRKLTAEDVKNIRREKALGCSAKELAARYCVSESHIYTVVKGDKEYAWLSCQST